jgi:hypothetical protein
LTIKVEIGFELGQRDPFAFVLDDPVKGLLDNTEYTLSGDRLFDVTKRVLSVSTKRGKSEALDRIDAGVASITVDNSDRLFDPLFEDGLYYGQLIPRRELRISANEKPVLYGYIDDFDIAYDPSGNSRVRIDVSDAFSVLVNSLLNETTPTSELSGARINAILDLPEVDWPANQRDIDSGDTVMLDTDIAEGTSALSYLQLVESSEFGTLFLSKDGKLVFRARNSAPNTIDLSFTDKETVPGFTTIPFSDIRIVYGSENLYNRIVLENADVVPEQAIAEDVESQLYYGVRTYTQTGVLVQDPEQLQYLADFLLARFKIPSYRFESIEVVLNTISLEKQSELLDLELGDIVEVNFTPSGIPPEVKQYCRIIAIDHDWNPTNRRVNFGLEKLDFGIFVLDSPALGVLDQNRLSYG